MQGEQQEADELRRLHLRLERANEHVSELQSRLASQASSTQTSCSDQLAEAQQAQELEIEALRQQPDSCQASGSSEGELEAQHAQQQLEIASLRRQLQESQTGCSSDSQQQLESLRAEVSQLQDALVNATSGGTAPGTAAANRELQAAIPGGGKQEAGPQLDILCSVDCSFDSPPEQWRQLAVQDSTAFCHQLALLQQEHQQQKAELGEQRATAAEQKAIVAAQEAKLAQQGSSLAQAAQELAEKASALQQCSEEVALLQSRLTDSQSVTSLQSDQLAVLQAEVDQLRCSLEAAEKQAGSTATDEQLQQEVADLKSRLQVILSEHHRCNKTESLLRFQLLMRSHTCICEPWCTLTEIYFVIPLMHMLST